MALSFVLLGAFGLVGCVPDPPPTASPSPSLDPVFDSEEEALAAAEEAYAAYLEMSDLIASEGGANPERIAEVATGELLESALDGFAEFREKSWRSTGRTVLTNAGLQFADLYFSDPQGVLAAYMCVDVSAVDVVDGQGMSVVSPDRDSYQAIQVTFDADHDEVLPSLVEAWGAEGVCGS